MPGVWADSVMQPDFNYTTNWCTVVIATDLPNNRDSML